MISTVYFTGLMTGLVFVTVFAVVSLIRRYWLCYWDYVNGITLDTIPADSRNAFFNISNITTNTSPFTVFHLFSVWVIWTSVTLVWPVSFPILIIYIVAQKHRKAIAEQDKFEKTIRG